MFDDILEDIVFKSGIDISKIAERIVRKSEHFLMNDHKCIEIFESVSGLDVPQKIVVENELENLIKINKDLRNIDVSNDHTFQGVTNKESRDRLNTFYDNNDLSIYNVSFTDSISPVTFRSLIYLDELTKTHTKTIFFDFWVWDYISDVYMSRFIYLATDFYILDVDRWK